MRLCDQRENGTQRRTHGDAEHVRIRQGISKQRLKAGSRYGQRCSHGDAEKNAWQADIHDDQAVIAGNLAALPENNPQQVAPQGVERNGHRPELQSNDHNYK